MSAALLSPLGQAAVRYAARGWSVFPCRPGGKAPLATVAPHGHLDATNDPETVWNWWFRNPEANIGLHVEMSGFVVVDPDLYKPDCQWGNFAAGHEIPRTLEQSTPRGGRHLFFASVAGEKFAGRLCPGVDVKHDGYVLVEPSIVDGRAYCFETDDPPARAPDWIPRKGEPAAAETAETAGTGEAPRERLFAEGDLAEVQDMLARARNDLARDDWVRLALALKAAFGEAVRDAFVEFSYRWPDTREGDPERVWRTAKPDGTATLGTVHHLLRPRVEPSDDGFDPDGMRVGGEEARGQGEAARWPTVYHWPAPASIPPREWLYGRHVLRAFASLTVSPGGIGKTSLSIADALGMVTGQNLLGGAPPPRPLTVWLWNGEDPAEEIWRKVAATAKHYGIGPDDVQGRLLVDSGRQVLIKLAKMQRGDLTIARPLVERLVDRLKTNAVDVLIVDPFATTHELPENDNTAINAAVDVWREVADRAQCGVEIYHHSQKAARLHGVEMGISQARGAGSLIEAVRSSRFLVQMTAEEAEKAGVENPRQYFHVTMGKVNLVADPGKATWHRLVSVNLGNGTLAYPEGDAVGVVTAWDWPDAFDGVSAAVLEEVMRRLGAADDELDGQENEQAARWAGYVVADVLGLDCGPRKKSDRAKQHGAARAKVRTVLRTWVESGALVRIVRRDSRNGRDVVTLRPAGDDEG